MKNHFIFLLIGALFISNCSESKFSTPIMTFNDTAYIKIIAENDFDSLVISTNYISLFPLQYLVQEKIIKGKGIYRIGYKITKPEMVEISIVDTFTTYIIPADTLVIKIGIDNSTIKGSTVYYIIDDPIYEFLEDEKKTFGNNYFNSNITNQAFNTMPTSQNDYKKMIQRLNSAQLERLAFVDKYKHELPNWYVNIQKNNIIYFSARLKFFQYFYLQNKNLMQNKIINEPPSVDVEIYNPEALLSTYYYMFLDSYFLMSCRIDSNLTGISRPITLYNNSSEYFNSMLKGDVLKYFNMYQLLKLNRCCHSMADLDSVSHFLKTHDLGLDENEMNFVNTELIKKRKEIEKTSELLIGKRVTNFALKDTTSKLLRLSEFNGKIVYLHFWATWCKPCIKEIPAINQLYERIGDKPVVIINICIDNQTEKWKQIIKKDNLKGINLICQGNWVDLLTKEYSIMALPQYSLIDKNGILLEYSSEHPNKIYEKLMQHLNDN